METLIVHPKNRKQLATVEAILKALNVSFQKEEKEEKDTYNPEFVAMVLESKKRAEEGNCIKLDPSKSLWENIM